MKAHLGRYGIAGSFVKRWRSVAGEAPNDSAILRRQVNRAQSLSKVVLPKPGGAEASVS
jgi:hypothetical protein